MLLVLSNFLFSFSSQGVGGEYPASSTSASEAANEQMLSKRGPGRLLDLISLSSMTDHVVQQFSSWPQTSFFA